MRKRTFRVLWAETAIRDLEGLVAYIAGDSPINAGKILSQLPSKAEALKIAPERGRLVPELLRHGLAVWRALLVRPYQIL